MPPRPVAGVPAPPTFTLRTSGGVTLGEWVGAGDDLGVDVAVTTHHGGVSSGPYDSLNLAFHVGDDPDAVLENRRRAAGAFGCTVDDLVLGEQVHGAGVAVVGEADRGRGALALVGAVPTSDALVTTDQRVVLVTLVADCVPLVLVDPAARVLATVHAGWRGALGGVGEAALDVLEDCGGDRRRVLALLGPSVAPERYQVGSDVAAAARARLGRVAERVLRPDGPAHWRLDVAEALRAVLSEAGVPAQRVASCPIATGDGGPFYSDRQARPCGRFALLARLRPYDEGVPTAV